MITITKDMPVKPVCTPMEMITAMVMVEKEATDMVEEEAMVMMPQVPETSTMMVIAAIMATEVTDMVKIMAMDVPAMVMASVAMVMEGAEMLIKRQKRQ